MIPWPLRPRTPFSPSLSPSQGASAYEKVIQVEAVKAPSVTTRTLLYQGYTILQVQTLGYIASAAKSKQTTWSTEGRTWKCRDGKASLSCWSGVGMGFRRQFRLWPRRLKLTFGSQYLWLSSGIRVPSRTSILPCTIDSFYAYKYVRRQFRTPRA